MMPSITGAILEAKARFEESSWFEPAFVILDPDSYLRLLREEYFAPPGCPQVYLGLSVVVMPTDGITLVRVVAQPWIEALAMARSTPTTQPA